MKAVSATIYSAAHAHLGVKEWAGAKHNPEILDFWRGAGLTEITDDETPWCAAFVGAVLGEVGLRGTGKPNARSYLQWGESVDLKDAEVGDVVVFWRGKPDGWQGHVAFYAGRVGNKIKVLGGNQGNSVSVADYDGSRLLGVRRAPAPRQSATQSNTVRASAAQIAAGVGTAGTAIGALDGDAQKIVLAFAGLSILLGIWIMRERIRKFANGDR